MHTNDASRDIFLSIGAIWLLASGFLAPSALALNSTNADAAFAAYNTAFYVNSGSSGYYKDDTSGGQTYFWQQAEEIEMALDAYDRTGSSATKNQVSQLCTGFINNNGSDWSWNKYNDDISWATIAFCRAYQITGNSNFRDRAKANFDLMYNRAWDTSFTGGGLWWTTDRGSKNACISGPAAVAACYLYSIYADPAYLAKAQDCYAWERRVLFNTNSGSIYDSIATNNTYNTWASTYNQGTFLGAGHYLFRNTGLPMYYQDALLAANYTRNNLSSAGILPAYSSGDLAGFNGIFARWIGKMARDQNLWSSFGPWLNANADAAWRVRNATNLSWFNWKSATPSGTNILKSWDCSSSVVIMQVGCTNSPDPLGISPDAGFTAAAQRAFPPSPATIVLALTNSSSSNLTWAVGNTASWLTASSIRGTLGAGGASTTLSISLNSAAVPNLTAGRYYADVYLTNLMTAVVQKRSFALIVSTSNTPIAVSGYNAGIIAANSATATSLNATAFDLVNSYCFYQAGLGSSTRGLPPNGVFTSLTDSNTVFQLGPYGGTNALMLGKTYPSSGTLTLNAPRAYNSLAVLATSANGGGLGTFVINFADGTQSPVFRFNAQDWYTGSTNIAIQGFGRLKLGLGSLVPDDTSASSPRLYQTTINLAAMGLSGNITSITFTNPAIGGNQASAILAVSGFAMPPQVNFVQQPASVTNNVPGQAVSLTALATGNPPLGYQWYFSATGSPGTFTPLSGQTTNVLTLDPVQLNNAGGYCVVVTNSLGAATSTVATVAVYRAPVIVRQPSPASLALFAGRDYSFSASANAALPVYYCWTFNGIALPGATNTTLPLTKLQVANSGLYSVTISNNYGSVTSSSALLTVIDPAYPFAPIVLSDRPLGYWRLDEARTASIAHDYIAGNNGLYNKTSLGQPGYSLLDTHTAARFGSLSTSNSCVTNIQVGFPTASNANFTVEAWVNGGAQTTDAGLVTKGYGSGGEQFNLDCGGSGHAFRFFVRDASGAAHLATSSVPPGNKWHHVVGVCDQLHGSVLLYVDGTNAAQGSISPNTGLLSSTNSVSIGSRQSGANSAYDMQFVGTMEDVAIYDHALSPIQVQAHYNALSAKPISASISFQGTNLVLNWTGGIPPYDVLMTTDLMTSAWQPVGSFLQGSNLTIAPVAPAASYRVRGQ